MSIRSTMKFKALPALMLAVAACGGDGPPPQNQQAAEAPAAAQPADTGTPEPTGNVIEVHMVTTMGGGSGEFQPAVINARPGDVIRFINDGGAPHNVSFPAAQNPGAANLPAASPYLIEQGATHEMAVNTAPGTYEFQCDPHVMMGMTGRLVVAN